MHSFLSLIVLISIALHGCVCIVSVSGETETQSELIDFNIFNRIWSNRELYWPSISNALVNYFKLGNLKGNVKQCYESLREMATAALKKEEWALSMIDAFGKPGAGILDGNVVWAGNYRECLNINKGQISGRYCWMETPLKKNSPDWNQTFSKMTRSSLRIGACVPNTCGKEELEELTSIIKRGIQSTVGFPESNSLLINVNCPHSQPIRIMDDPVALASIGVCITFLVLMIIGTVLDLLIRNIGLKIIKTSLIAGKKNGCIKNNNNDYRHNGNHTSISPENDIQMILSHAKPSTVIRFLICFSVYTNWKMLFSSNQSKNSIPEIDGLKAISTSAVIFGHTYLHAWRIVDNPLEMGQVMGYWYMQFPANFYYFVDTFLVLTGFLTMKVILKQYMTTGRSCNLSFVLSYIFHRYWRLVTTYGLILFVTRIGLLSYFSSGPFWQNMEPFCSRNWWKNLLFISNFWPLDRQCYLTSWYMSLCMQYHLLALLIIIPLFYKKYRWLSVINGSIMLIISWCWTGWLAYKHDLPASYSAINRKDISYYLEKMQLYKDIIYMTPFYHIGSYLAGMATGWILHEYNNVLVLSKKQVTVGWATCCVLGLGTVHLMYFDPNRVIKSLHMTLSITIWSICICWIIIACCTGNGGIVRSFLSWRGWMPLGKLSLTIYLIQGSVVEYMTFSELAPLHFSEYNFFGLFLRHWLVSIVFAIPVSLSFEAPFLAIEKLISNMRLKNNYVNKQMKTV